MIALTYFPSLREPHGQRRSCSWGSLCRWLSAPVVSAHKHAVAGFSVATYRDDRRALANVEQVFAVGLDLDHGIALGDVHARFAKTSAFVHTTWSSTLDAPRARVFLALSRPVSGEEYRRVYEAVTSQVEDGGIEVDRAASDPSRFWFRPSVAAEGCSFVYWTSDGAPVDVEAALAAVPPLPPPAPVPSRPPGPVGDVEARAAAYLDRCDPAISGSGGHAQTFRVAQALVRGFALDDGTAYRLLARWNERCQPPWDERALRRKLSQAVEHGRMADGELRDRRRAS
jgi:hypothetical protein